MNWLDSILGMLLVPLPFLVLELLKEGSMGGGDIKLVGACSFFLGFSAGLMGSVAGLTLAIVTNILYFRYKKMEYDKSFPLIPYLGGAVVSLDIVIN